MKKKLLAILLALALVLGLSATAIATTGETTLSVFFRDIIVTRNGEEVVLKDEQGNILEPFLYNSSTYLPIRAIAQATGATVEWDGDTHTVILDYPEQEPEYIYVPVVAPSEPEKLVNLPEAVDKSTLPRVIITTDLECDDMNGIILSLMFASDYDLAGIVWTAGKFHFNGDGEGTTFAEFCQEMTNFDGEPYTWTCEATHCGGTVENVGEVTEHRPVDPTFLTRIIDVNYRRDYEYLIQNNPNYPTPDELLEIAKVGNVEFEGDYRYETEGSQLIYDAIMDDDMRPLYIQHWGGINTTVRALMSIYEDYYGTAEWEAVKEKVVSKVRLVGRGEDGCLNHSQLEDESRFGAFQNSDWSGFGGFTNYFAVYDAPDMLKPYYKADYLTDAFKFGHGALMSDFLLMSDGQVIYGEPFCFQYGLVDYIDWTICGKEGWSNPMIGTPPLNFFPLGQRSEYDAYDWCCCQWGTSSFVDLGLRQGVKNSNNLFVEDLFDEVAARADWAVMAPEDCNHAPIVSADVLDFTAKAGEAVTLNATVTDPDGDKLNITWWVPSGSWTYAAAQKGAELTAEGNGSACTFTVPADAVAGDRFVVNMEVQDTGVERPMTRYAQFIITVE